MAITIPPPQMPSKLCSVGNGGPWRLMDRTCRCGVPRMHSGMRSNNALRLCSSQKDCSQAGLGREREDGNQGMRLQDGLFMKHLGTPPPPNTPFLRALFVAGAPLHMRPPPP
ncbi:UNVERIFIED_CONTAM: hypothetical protein K2H54_007863 [Gekko kuhli]